MGQGERTSLQPDLARIARRCQGCIFGVNASNNPEIIIFVVVSNAIKERPLAQFVVVEPAVNKHRPVGGGVGDIGRHIWQVVLVLVTCALGPLDQLPC